MVPLSHLDDNGGQPPAPEESPEVRQHGALEPPRVLFFLMVDQVALRGARFASC